MRPLYAAKPVLVFKGEPEIRGQFAYTPGVDGFNYTSERMTLDRLFELLLANYFDTEPPSFYCGSTDIDTFMPGLLQSDVLPLHQSYEPGCRFHRRVCPASVSS